MSLRLNGKVIGEVTRLMIGPDHPGFIACVEAAGLKWERGVFDGLYGVRVIPKEDDSMTEIAGNVVNGFDEERLRYDRTETGSVPDDQGPWTELLDGRKFYPLHPVSPPTWMIARVLSTTFRYNSHSGRGLYSVAEHSALIAEWLYQQTKDPVLALQGLFHDGSEATCLPDIPRPVKVLIDQAADGFLKRLEDSFIDAIYRAHDLPEGMPPIVKECDSRILVDERAQIMTPTDNVWATDGMEPLGVKIRCLPAKDAEAYFLKTFEALDRIRKR